MKIQYSRKCIAKKIYESGTFFFFWLGRIHSGKRSSKIHTEQIPNGKFRRVEEFYCRYVTRQSQPLQINK